MFGTLESNDKTVAGITRGPRARHPTSSGVTHSVQILSVSRSSQVSVLLAETSVGDVRSERDAHSSQAGITHIIRLPRLLSYPTLPRLTGVRALEFYHLQIRQGLVESGPFRPLTGCKCRLNQIYILQDGIGLIATFICCGNFYRDIAIVGIWKGSVIFF